jgi:cytochrome b subunit of formate dehydrogenase
MRLAGFGAAGKASPMTEKRYLRFPITYRVEHWILTLTFTTLAITGLAQKFALNSLSQWVVGVLGGVGMTRAIHHVAAGLMMGEVVFHIGIVGYRMLVLRLSGTMIPTLLDMRAAYGALLFNLGLSDKRPAQGRYGFEEKAEYWAVVWGTLVMAVTGFMMLNPIATARLLPGDFIPAAKSAHGGEALLAVLAIIVWHLYHVHIRSFNTSMFTGYMSGKEMEDEHGLELAEIESGRPQVPPPAVDLKRRQRIYLPAYGVMAILLLVGIYQFLTFEQTAIPTLPPAENVVIYSPLTPTPFPTALPTQTASGNRPTSWDNGIGSIFGARCSACHSGASAMHGLDLSTYASALKGGQSGKVILPGDPNASPLVQLQAAGGHPGQFSGEELDAIRSWIESGAPEK